MINDGWSMVPQTDEMVPPEMEGRPDHDIGNQQHSAVDIADQQDVDQAEGAGHQQQADHGTSRRKADGQELVVDVVLVRLERVAPVAKAEHHDPHDIEGGDDERGERDEESIVRIGLGHRIGLGILHGQEAQGIAQRQAARVAHEDLAGTLGAAEHIVVEEGDQHSERGGCQHGVAPHPFLDEQAREHQQGHAAQARSQAVDAVDEVDGISDEHYHKDGEGHAYPRGKLMDAQQAVEVVDPQAGQGEQAGAEYLQDELLAVADTDQVVGDAGEVEHGHAADVEQHLGKEMEGIGPRQTLARQQADSEHDGIGKEHRGKKGHAAQAGNGPRMHLTGVGYVEQLLPHRDEQDAGNDYLRNAG